jgi:hypothetical protein
MQLFIVDVFNLLALRKEVFFGLVPGSRYEGRQPWSGK